MKKMSTGQDSTLGNYRQMALLFFGEDSGAVEYLDQLIAESPNGADEEVIADEEQVVGLLFSLTHSGGDDGSSKAITTRETLQ
jgi:hypothetical protein